MCINTYDVCMCIFEKVSTCLWMYVCVYIRMMYVLRLGIQDVQGQRYINIHAYIHACIHTYMNVQSVFYFKPYHAKDVLTYIHKHIHTHAHTYIHIYIHT